MTLVVVITLLFVCLTGVLAAVYFKKATTKETLANIDTTDVSGYISVASPTPTPIPPITDYQNPILYPGLASVNINKELAIDKNCVPSARGINETVMVNGNIVEPPYSRENPIYMNDPVFYGSIPGIFAFRGNNFRNCASFGYVTMYRGSLTQRWEFNEIGTLLASTLNFEWSGVRWTGQPLVVEWPAAVRQNMDMYDSAKQQMTLTEVIVAALDGKIYFFNLDTQTYSRNAIDVGYPLQATASVNPYGYPLLYVGQISPATFYLYNLAHGAAVNELWAWIGAIIATAGVIIEMVADAQKSAAKKINARRFVDTGLYRIVRCPNYFGEVLMWTGSFLICFGACCTFWQWVIAIIGYIGIVYVMFSGARRLELRQTETYGNDPEFQAYIKKTPLIIPFVPIYSVAKHKWLQA
jgi:protein-S-isoprenylcysteine O-methyltransferase Ste14